MTRYVEGRRTCGALTRLTNQHVDVGRSQGNIKTEMHDIPPHDGAGNVATVGVCQSASNRTPNRIPLIPNPTNIALRERIGIAIHPQVGEPSTRSVSRSDEVVNTGQQNHHSQPVSEKASAEIRMASYRDDKPIERGLFCHINSRIGIGFNRPPPNRSRGYADNRLIDSRPESITENLPGRE